MNILLFLLVFFAFFSSDFKHVFILAFFLGLIYDLALANLIGFSSLLMLVICLVIYLYRRRFSSHHLLFQLSFLLLSSYFFTILSSGSWSIKKSLVVLILGLIIVPLINKIKARTSFLELEV